MSPKAMAKVEKIERFRDWLLLEAADDARRLSELPHGRSKARNVVT